MGETMTMQTSDTLGKFATAMAKAQSMMGGATKGSRNPHFNSAFADLASVVNAVKGPLSTNGIAFVQMPSSTGDLVAVTTRLVHSSGEWMQCTLSARPRKSDPQGVGSVVTYLKRYTLQAMCGVPSEDDDGNAGSQGPERQQERPQAFDRNAAVATIEAAWSEHYKGTAADWAQSVGFDLKQETRDGLIHLLQDVQAGTVRGADGLRK
jgi:hypothetical protein